MEEDISRLEAKIDENTRLLKKLLLHNRWISLVAAVKWLVVLGAALGVYYYFQPAIDQLIELYKNILAGYGQLMPR